MLAQVNAPIRIGNINSYTGGLAYAGENNLNGMNLYFDSINWTVAGRKIEIIKEDDQFNPQVGLQKAKKLVESDKVDLVMGIQASNVALAVLNYMKQQKAFYVVSGAGTDAITWDAIPISSAPRSRPVSSPPRWRNTSTTISARRSSRPRPTMPAGHDVMAQFKRPSRQGRQGAQGNLAAAQHHGLQPVPDRHQVDQSAGDLRFHPGADTVRFVQQYSEFGLKEKMPLTGFTSSTRKR